MRKLEQKGKRFLIDDSRDGDDGRDGHGREERCNVLNVNLS